MRGRPCVEIALLVSASDEALRCFFGASLSYTAIGESDCHTGLQKAISAFNTPNKPVN